MLERLLSFALPSCTLHLLHQLYHLWHILHDQHTLKKFPTHDYDFFCKWKGCGRAIRAKHLDAQVRCVRTHVHSHVPQHNRYKCPGPDCDGVFMSSAELEKHQGEDSDNSVTETMKWSTPASATADARQSSRSLKRYRTIRVRARLEDL
ncbi:hypothetical protein EXIGLDRAFT_840159 [Exidia glandulosa HHB12029]|uniref:C2H2-type domain-containing protein n=1 Tax=Exidia glandulosa HHB12029 TaxID=1314781 RepID=A0A165ELQ0_EXIGL|nr:hypothetical protein EXIGLDRAFT_840159 [Exidia glandulosa HHB12029]